jgi:CheY-like chemotaxis protein
MPELPRNLVDQFTSGNGVLWIGAGLSVASGLPSWNELIDKMRGMLAERGTFSEEELKHSLNNLETAQLFRDIEGADAYENFLRGHLRDQVQANVANNKMLAAIMELINRLWPHPGLLIVSTNFDTLLEDAFYTKYGKRAQQVIRTQHTKLVQTSRDLIVIKPNGDIDDIESIVFTMQDYYAYRETKRHISEVVENLMRQKTFLFVGYGLGDFTFNSMLGSLQATLGKFPRTAYVIANNDSPARNAVLKSIGIEVVPIDNYDGIPGLLNKITMKVKQTKENLSGFVSETLRDTTFLLIDDETTFIDSVQEMYKRYGWTGLRAVTNLNEAMQLMRQQQFDFILTDLMMEGSPTSGIDVIASARRTKKNANSILAVWSQRVDDEIQIKCFEAGADQLFTKDRDVREIFLRLFALRRVRDQSYAKLSKPAQAGGRSH